MDNLFDAAIVNTNWLFPHTKNCNSSTSHQPGLVEPAQNTVKQHARLASACLNLENHLAPTLSQTLTSCGCSSGASPGQRAPSLAAGKPHIQSVQNSACQLNAWKVKLTTSLPCALVPDFLLVPSNCQPRSRKMQLAGQEVPPAAKALHHNYGMVLIVRMDAQSGPACLALAKFAALLLSPWSM